MENASYAVCYGEVLWDILDGKPQLGGAPLNVCYHLSKLGLASTIISQVGYDQAGKNLLSEMENLGVSGKHCSVSSEYPTSTVIVHTKEDKVTYEITANVAWDHITVDPALLPIIAGADVFIYGSLAARNVTTRDTLFTYLAHAKWKVFDINLRANHYSRQLILDLLTKCQTLKVNDEELALLGDWLDGVAAQQEAIIAALFTQFSNIEEIILTSGATGATYYGGGEKITAPGIKVDVVDTVGCGDALLAAFVAQKLAGKSIQECLVHAVNLSAFIATKRGGCPDYETDHIPGFIATLPQ